MSKHVHRCWWYFNILANIFKACTCTPTSSHTIVNPLLTQSEEGSRYTLIEIKDLQIRKYWRPVSVLPIKSKKKKKKEKKKKEKEKEINSLTKE